MLPFAGHPLAHCSATRIRLCVGFGSRSKLPTPKYVPPNPASAITRFDSGDDHVACTTFNGRPSTPVASGDTRAGSEFPGVEPVHARHMVWASQYTPNLFRGVSCQVSRAAAFSNVRSEYAGRLVSGE